MKEARKWICVGETPAVRLAVLDDGPRDAPVLFFLHGGAGRSTQWRHQMEYFSSRFRVLSFDFRGHGESEVAPSGYTFETIVHDFELALEALEIDRFALIGHSFGGAVAAGYAAKKPAGLERLALVATAGEIPLSPLTSVLLKCPTGLLNQVRKVFKNQINCPPVVLKQLVPNLMRWRGWDLYPQIEVPTLVLSGELDMLTRPSAMRKMAELLPDCEFVSLPFSGHLPQLERPAAVNRILERFLEPGLKRSWRGPLETPA